MIVRQASFSPTAPPDINGNSPVIGWQQLLETTSIVADTEDADFPATNLANPNTSSVWLAGTTAAQDIDITLDGETIDYVAICRHNFATAGITVALVVDAVTVIAAFTPTDDGPIILQFTPEAASAVTISLGSGSEAATAAVLYVGRLLVLPRRWYVGHAPVTMARETGIVHNRSESGQFLGRVITGEGRRTGHSLQNLSPTWVRTYLDPFFEAARSEPFFFAWRPETYPLETGYGWLANEPRPVNSRTNGMMSADLEIGAIA